jgi:hypothetical protein
MGRAALVVLLLVTLFPCAASADWLITPYIGTAFGSETTFLVLERGGYRKMTFGGSVALLSDALLGVEADVSHVPGFFEGDNPVGLVQASRVTTVSGNLIVALPLAVTRESLRPYVVGGLGLLQVRANHVASVFPLQKDLLGLSVGGGVIGLVSERTGIRFDLRHIKAITGEDGPLAQPGDSRLSFWRASIGLILRY